MGIASQERKDQLVNQARAPQASTAVERTGFGEIEIKPRAEVASTALAASAKAIVEARVIVAGMNPRDPDAVRQRMLKRCESYSFAYGAIYTLPARAGSTKEISGPSIRFVEAALQEMGHFRTTSVTIQDGPEQREVLIGVTDLQTNNSFDKSITIYKTVERKRLRDGQTALGRRVNSYGDVVYIVEASEDDLITKEAALTSKVMRGLALRLIDPALVEECLDAIDATIEKKNKADPDGERKRLIDGFFNLGVRVTDLKAYLGVDPGALTPADFKMLRQVWIALKEGHTTWAEVVEARKAVLGEQPATTGAPVDQATSVLERLQRNKAKQGRAESGGQPEPAATATEGSAGQETPSAGTYAAEANSDQPQGSLLDPTGGQKG